MPEGRDRRDCVERNGSMGGVALGSEGMDDDDPYCSVLIENRGPHSRGGDLQRRLIAEAVRDASDEKRRGGWS